jgi:hypothetical protein
VRLSASTELISGLRRFPAHKGVKKTGLTTARAASFRRVRRGPAGAFKARRKDSACRTARDRSTVRLVKMTALETPTSLSADDQPPPAAAENPIAAPPASALEKIQILIDDDQAAAKLCHQCRRADAEASDEEILHFLELRIDSRRRRAVVGGNWREEVIAAVPVYFTQRIPIERYRLEHPRRSERC